MVGAWRKQRDGHGLSGSREMALTHGLKHAPPRCKPIDLKFDWIEPETRCVGVAWDRLACGVSPATAQARQLNGYFVPTETDFGAKRQSAY
ncbi:MAG TPA: hypothetical protein DIT01_05060 [Lentisphaeria bacterium]|nr:hypothetical protein [Lentisphaeria bacterium]